MLSETKAYNINRTVYEKIDICRGLFCILVVVAHALDIFESQSIQVARDGFIKSFGHHLLSHGFYWVIGFFVISGFCIQLSCQRLRAIDPTYFPWKKYILARATRIAPLYYICLLLALIVEIIVYKHRANYWGIGINESGLFSQLLFSQNITTTFGSYAPRWSITNEIFYYLLHCVLITKFPHRYLKIGFVLCGTNSLVFALLYVLIHTKIFLNISLVWLLGLVWYLGVYIADYHEEILKHLNVSKNIKFWPILLAMVSIADYLQWIHPQLRNLILGLVFAAMILNFIEQGSSGQVKKQYGKWNKFFTYTGLISYPLYLSHGPILMLLSSLNINLNLSILISISIIFGLALYELVEKPLLRWRKNIIENKDNLV